MTDIELQIDALMDEWRTQESAANLAAERAQESKNQIIRLMQQAGLKTYDGMAGKVTTIKSVKTNIVVDRKEFDQMLKSKGMYDRFCTTKFDMAKVKEYVEREDDDLYGMVELEETYSTRFTPANRGKEANG